MVVKISLIYIILSISKEFPTAIYKLVPKTLKHDGRRNTFFLKEYPRLKIVMLGVMSSCHYLSLLRCRKNTQMHTDQELTMKLHRKTEFNS